MAKFLFLWEEDTSQMPAAPGEIAALLGKQIEMTKQALDNGDIKDWGLFAGGNRGYAIGEGEAIDAFRGAMQFYPYVKFEVHPVLSLAEVAEGMKSMMP